MLIVSFLHSILMIYVNPFAGISAINNLDRCVSLTDLNLSGNNIANISGLDTLASLQRLDLSLNRITRIGMLQIFAYLFIHIII